MTYQEFMALDEDARAAAWVDPSDIEAERDSLRTENEQLRADAATRADELKKTKELNFTLARKIDVSNKKQSAEEIMNEIFK